MHPHLLRLATSPNYPKNQKDKKINPCDQTRLRNSQCSNAGVFRSWQWYNSGNAGYRVIRGTDSSHLFRSNNASEPVPLCRNSATAGDKKKSANCVFLIEGASLQVDRHQPITPGWLAGLIRQPPGWTLAHPLFSDASTGAFDLGGTRGPWQPICPGTFCPTRLRQIRGAVSRRP